MKINKEEHIDNFTKKIIQDAGLEKPSIDFTAMVMSKVEVEMRPIPSKATVYEAPISRNGWLVMAAVLAGFTLFILLGNSPDRVGWLAQQNFKLDLSFLLPQVSYSKAFTYGIFSLAIMLVIEVSFLKRYFERMLH